MALLVLTPDTLKSRLTQLPHDHLGFRCSWPTICLLCVTLCKYHFLITWHFSHHLSLTCLVASIRLCSPFSCSSTDAKAQFIQFIYSLSLRETLVAGSEFTTKIPNQSHKFRPCTHMCYSCLLQLGVVETWAVFLLREVKDLDSYHDLAMSIKRRNNGIDF